MNNIFVIPSTIQPFYGVVSHEDRYIQTLETIKSIKNIVKDEHLIVLIDSSAVKLSQEKLENLKNNVDVFLDFSDDQLAQEFNGKWLKSPGENYLLFNAIIKTKQLFDLTNKKGRMYKLGGRCFLLPKFNSLDHTSIEDRYIFKNTWRTLEEQKICNSTHLLETRFYSWPFNFVDDYLEVIKKNFEMFNYGLDTEHAHFLNIPKDKLVEFDKMNVGCIMAANGNYMED